MSGTNTERDYSKRSQIASIDEQRGRIDKQISATTENQQERKQYQYSPSSSSDIEKVGFSFYPHVFTNSSTSSTSETENRRTTPKKFMRRKLQRWAHRTNTTLTSIEQLLSAWRHIWPYELKHTAGKNRRNR